MTKERYGVLVHGAGWVSSQHIAAFANNPYADIVAISSRRLESARERAEEAKLDGVATYDDYDAALRHDGVDIVAICTPQHVHCENVLAATKLGKHVVIEKPVATTLEDMHRMTSAVEAAGVKSVVSFVLRWNPLLQTVKRLIADGGLGQVYSVETDYQSYCGDWWGGYEDARRADTGVSAFLVGGCHAIDAMRWFAAPGEHEAATPVEVFAYEGGVRGRSTLQYDPTKNDWHEGAPLEFAGLEMALVRFSNGVLGKVSVNFESIGPYTFPLRVFGDRGTVRDNRIWSHHLPGQTDWIELPTVCPDSSDVTHHPFQGQIDHFVDCIRTDTESHCNLADAVRTHEIVFAAQKCYETGAPVKLPL